MQNAAEPWLLQGQEALATEGYFCGQMEVTFYCILFFFSPEEAAKILPILDQMQALTAFQGAFPI